jgi:hypothetical protein
MSKFLLNFLLQIFQSLGKFKNPILIQKFLFFPDFWPGRPRGPLGLWPSQPTGRAVPTGRNRPGRPLQPARRSRLRGKYVFLFGSRLPEPAPLPRLSVNQAPYVRCVFPTAPVDPGFFLLSPPATPRRPTSDLVMPGKTITPRLGSPL